MKEIPPNRMRPQEKADGRERFGNLVRSARDEAGLSLRELGRSIDYDPRYIGRIERGEVPASIGVAKALADAMGRSRADFLEASGHLSFGDEDPDEVENFKFGIDAGIIEVRLIEEFLSRSPPPNSSWEIEKKVGRILHQYEEDYGRAVYPAVPVADIATRRCHFRIRQSSQMQRHQFGRVDFALRVIEINSRFPKESPGFRLALAHELGHHFIRTHDDFILHISRRRRMLWEHEANVFAYCLLMPESRVREAVQMSPGLDRKGVRDLAERFAVTNRMMCYRLHDLGMVRSDSSQKYRRWLAMPIWKREMLLKGI